MTGVGTKSASTDESKLGPILEIDAANQRRARRYSSAKLRVSLASGTISFALLATWAFSPLGTAVLDWIHGFTNSPWLGLPLFLYIIGASLFLIGLPFTYIGGYVIPKRFGQLHQPLGGWFGDLAKGMGVSIVLMSLIFWAIFWFMRLVPGWWWVLTALGALVFILLLSTLAPVLLFPLFFKFSPLPDGELKDRLLTLAKRCRTRVKGVYTFDMSKKAKGSGAFLAGMGATRRMALTDTMVKDFPAVEIETVMAHELGHQVHNDMWWLIGSSTVFTFLSMGFIHFLLLTFADLSRGAALGDPALLPMFIFLVSVISFLGSPFTKSVIRWREREADRFSLQLTGKPMHFASAFRRLALTNLATIEVHPLVEWWSHDHPALGKRIAMAERYQKRIDRK